MGRNQDFARLLYELAELLELENETFKPRAYRRAAQNIEALGKDIADLAAQGKLDEIPGVGESIRKKLEEFLATGTFQTLERMRKAIPPGLHEMLQLPGVGPKTAKRLFQELGIKDLDQLEKKAKAGRIRGLKGFGEKSEQEILAAIDRRRKAPARVPYPVALETVRELIPYLQATKLVHQVEAAGSLRRGRDTVGDIDILATAKKGDVVKVVEAFKEYRQGSRVLASGSTRSSVLLQSGIQVDLRIVDEQSFGAALLYFTGSKPHNIALRALALKKDWTLNEYALSRKKDGKPVARATEKEIYEALGLAWVPPELREDQGEIALAAAKDLPDLVTVQDLCGDLHTHTDESDGRVPLDGMVAEAERLGYAWYGVSDHSFGLKVANGLDHARYARQAKHIARVQGQHPKLTILHGAEVDIKKDGTLDLEPRTRDLLDYVVGSVHSHFKLPRNEQTQRLLRALDEGVDVLGHPTTRLVPRRPEIDVDWEKVFLKAAEQGVALEINALPDRMDLAGEKVRLAKEVGCRFSVDSDAHSLRDLHQMEYGITQARRGGLAAKDVLTAMTHSRVVKHLGHARRG